MKTFHSTSLVLVWRVAEFEARHSKASTINPTHLLLGLCKIVDLDLTQLISKDSPDRNQLLEELLREVRKLHTVFQAAGVDAKTFRRRLRQPSVERRFELAESDRLRRSPAAKQVFADAEQFAQIAGSAVFPVHLLYATLLSKDEHRDAILIKLQIDIKRFLAVAKRKVFLPQIDSSSGLKRAKAIWN